MLYDEKFFLDAKNAFNPKDQATWLEVLKDYLNGSTPELNALFSWAEAQPVEIARANEYKGCLGCATPDVRSQQLWALLGGLVKADATTKCAFANVPRHNGLEAWRRVAEPLNEDKALRRKD